MSVAASSPWPARWQAFRKAAVRGFHGYAGWLVGISWKRFVLYALALLVGAAIVEELPPFRFTSTEVIEQPATPAPPRPPKPAPAPTEPAASRPAASAPAPAPAASKPQATIRVELPGRAASAPGSGGLDIRIDERGIRIGAPPAAGAGAGAAADEIVIRLPDGVDREAVRQAIEEARRALEDAAAERRAAAREAEQAAKELADAERQARDAERDARRAERAAERATREAEAAGERVSVEPGPGGTVRRVRVVHWDNFLTDLALLWILGSAIVKAGYKGRIQAEVKAAQATETAEAESLRRQVAEARMAAMQAQIEPHFLFNTLASIDHLIETDPPRASRMQKNLIALLRASMPTMREANGGAGAAGTRDLGRELAVIRPYLEILKVRMEERLATEIRVPDGLLSAEFPPMMIQTLVENAIQHGLEPKPEGGMLTVAAEIVHGKLQVRVADTGLGFGRAPTAGTGVGLANIRERLQMLYANKASLTVAENAPCGTVVTITVPYRSTADADGAQASGAGASVQSAA